MKSTPLLILPLLFLGMAGSALSQSAVPDRMNYQGRVSNSSGAIGAGTAVNRLMHFKFWKSPTSTAAGDLLYSESTTVTINDGNFSVLLGGGGQIGSEPHVFANAFNSADLFLGITVDLDDNGSMANDTEISPRQQLVTSAFAFRSKVAEGVDAGAITATMLANTAVTANKIAVGAVNVTHLAAGAVKGGNDLDGNPNLRGMIVDGSITAYDLATNSVDTLEIKADAVTSAKIKNGEVKTEDILNANVTHNKLADNAVESINIKDGNVALADLVAAVQQSLCPVGTILPYAGDSAPTGWLLCNGDYHVAANYPALFTLIGFRFGSSSGGYYFRGPDLRGRFLRGRDGSVGRDADRGSRTAMHSGGAVGDNVGSVQGDAFRSHSHKWLKGLEGDDSGGGGSYKEFTEAPGSSDTVIEATGGSETRPVNAYVNYIIKY